MDLIGINISNISVSSSFNEGISLAGKIFVSMLFGFSIVTFISGVIQLVKNNDYKEIKSSAIFLGIFSVIFILYKALGVF
jgi:hypothetical protein